MIAAPPGIGKTFLSLSMIRGLTLGQPIFGNDDFKVPAQARVLYIDQEVSPPSLQRRLSACFTNQELLTASDYFYAISGHPELSFSDPAGFQTLMEEVERVQPNVLVMDPIANLHNYEENSNTEISRLFQQINLLKAAGSDWGMSVVIVHHVKKPTEGVDPLDYHNIRGASVYIAQPDTILMLEKQVTLQRTSKSWSLKARFSKVRHDAEVPTFLLKVNENDDMRVVFDRYLTPGGGTLDNGIRRFAATPPTGAGQVPTSPLH